MENESKSKNINKYFPKVCIIILNWNSWKDTIYCLESIFKIEYESYDILIIDNASEDDSVKNIINYLEFKVKLKPYKFKSKNKSVKYIYKNEKSDLNSTFHSLTILENEDNYGFAKGNNIGIKYVKKELNPDYYLLLNNDTIVDKKFLNELVNIAELKSNIGFIGPKIYYYDSNGKTDVINFAGGTLNIWKGQISHIGLNKMEKKQLEIVNEVDYIQGSCLLFKKEIIRDVGLMNPNYFMYWEEVDWCYKSYKKGYKSIFAPKAKIWHKTLASSGGSYNCFVAYYMTRNRFLFMKSNASKMQLISFLIYYFLFDFWINLVYFSIKEDKKSFSGFINGFKDGLKCLFLNNL